MSAVLGFAIEIIQTLQGLLIFFYSGGGGLKASCMYFKNVLVFISGVLFSFTIGIAKARGDGGGSKPRPKSLPIEFASQFEGLKLCKSEGVLDQGDNCLRAPSKGEQSELMQQILGGLKEEVRAFWGKSTQVPAGISSRCSVVTSSDDDSLVEETDGSLIKTLDMVAGGNNSASLDGNNFKDLLSKAFNRSVTKPTNSKIAALVEVPVLNYADIVQWGWQPSEAGHFMLPVSWDVTTNEKPWRPDLPTTFDKLNTIIAHLAKNEFLQLSYTGKNYKETGFPNGAMVRVFGWKLPESPGTKHSPALAKLLLQPTWVQDTKKTNPVLAHSLSSSPAEPFAEIIRSHILPLLGYYRAQLQPSLQDFLSSVHGEELGEKVTLKEDDKKELYIDCYFGEQGMTVVITQFYNRDLEKDKAGSGANVTSSLQLEYRFADDKSDDSSLRCSGLHLNSHFMFLATRKGKKFVAGVDAGRRVLTNQRKTHLSRSSQGINNTIGNKGLLPGSASSILTRKAAKLLPRKWSSASTLTSTQLDTPVGDIAQVTGITGEPINLMPFGKKFLAIRGVRTAGERKQEQITDGQVMSANVEELYFLGLRAPATLETMLKDFQFWYQSKVMPQHKALSGLKLGSHDFEEKIIWATSLADGIFAEAKRISPEITYHSGEISLSTYQGLQSLLKSYKEMNKRGEHWYRELLQLYEECKKQATLDEQQVKRLAELANSVAQEEQNFRGAASSLGSLARTLENEVRQVSPQGGGVMFLARDYQFQILLYSHALITRLIELVLVKGNADINDVPIFLGSLQEQVSEKDQPKVIKKIINNLGYSGITADDVVSLESLGSLIVQHFPASGGKDESLRVFSVCLSGAHLN